MHRAVKEGNEREVEDWISKGVDIDFETHDDTPLFIAVKLNKLKMCELLLDHGANINIFCGNMKSSLHLAVYQNRADVVALLLRGGARLDAIDEVGDTALHYAASARCADLIPPLIKEGMSVNVLNGAGHSPLYKAVQNANPQTVKALIEGGGVLGETEHTFMHWAVINKDSSKIIDMLAPTFLNPMIVKAKDNDGNTAMHLANTVESIRKLASLGYDIRAKGKWGWLPIHVAARSKKPHLVEAFVEMDGGLLDYCYQEEIQVHDRWHTVVCCCLLQQSP